MTPQELKNSILQLAIQGKLVEQRPEEGMAELPFGCSTKKEYLKKRSVSEEEKTLEIPNSWIWTKLSMITTKDTLNDGNWVLSKDMVTTGTVKLIQLGSIGNCQYIEKGFKYLTEKHFQELNGREIFGGYLLINRMIGDRLLDCIIPNLEGKLMTAVDVCWVAPQDDIYDINYLMYAIASNDFQEKAKALGRGTTRFRISKGNLIDIAFPFPPLGEQKRIVKRIEELLPLVDQYEEVWNRLEELNKRFPIDLQKSILQYAIQGKLVDQFPQEGTGEELYSKLVSSVGTKNANNNEELDYSSMAFAIPENWKMVELNQLFDFVDYRGKTPHKIDKGIFLITASNIKRGFLDYTRKEYISREEYEGRKSRGVTKAGDLLFTTEAPMGNAAICDLAVCSCGQRIITFQPYIKDVAVPTLFMYFILSPSFQQQLLSNCTGTTAKGIKAKKLKKFIIPLPPLAEQKRIVESLEVLLPLCNNMG